MANKEAARQQASMASLRAQGEERVMKQADEASQKRLGQAIAKTAEEDFKRKQEETEYESKLKAVKIEKTDVDVLADQFDLPKPLAERQLRIAGGDLQAALRTLVGLAR